MSQARAVPRRQIFNCWKETRVRIGVLTGGGDCPGLNAAIRAVVKHGELAYGHSVGGFRNGWKGWAGGGWGPRTGPTVPKILPAGVRLPGVAAVSPPARENGWN